MGTIVGSAVFNIMIIVGVTALCAGQDLEVWWYPLVRDSAVYAISIIMMVIVMIDKKVFAWEGAVMVVAYFGYIMLMVYNERIVRWIEKRESAKKGGSSAKVVVAADGVVSDDSIAAQAAALAGLAETGGTGGSTTTADGGKTPEPRKIQMNPTLRPMFRPTYGDAEKKRKRNLAVEKMFHTSVTTVLTVNRARKSFMKLANKDKRAEKYAASPDAEGAGGEEKSEAAAVTALAAFGGGGGVVAAAAEESAAKGGGAAEGGDDEGEDGIGDKIINCLACPIAFVFKWTIPPCTEEGWEKWYMGTFTMSIVWIGILSFVMVDFASRAGCVWGVPGLVMGLIVIAAGTSVPDALSSVLVAKMGQGNMAVANVLGSNVFNIFLGLGLPWMVKAISDGEAVQLPKDEDIVQPVLILLGYLVFFMGVIWWVKWQLNATVAKLFFVGHAVFVIWNLLTQMPNPVISIG